MRFSLRGVMLVVFIILMFYYVAYFHVGLQIPMKINFSRASFQTSRSEQVSPASTEPDGMCGGVWEGVVVEVFEFVLPSNYYYFLFLYHFGQTVSHMQ